MLRIAALLFLLVSGLVHAESDAPQVGEPRSEGQVCRIKFLAPLKLAQIIRDDSRAAMTSRHRPSVVDAIRNHALGASLLISPDSSGKLVATPEFASRREIELNHLYDRIDSGARGVARSRLVHKHKYEGAPLRDASTLSREEVLAFQPTVDRLILENERPQPGEAILSYFARLAETRSSHADQEMMMGWLIEKAISSGELLDLLLVEIILEFPESFEKMVEGLRTQDVESRLAKIDQLESDVSRLQHELEQAKSGVQQSLKNEVARLTRELQAEIDKGKNETKSAYELAHSKLGVGGVIVMLVIYHWFWVLPHFQSP